MTDTVLRLSPMEAAVADTCRRADGAPQATTHDIALEVVRDMAGFEALEDEWTTLFAEHCDTAQLFQSYRWCLHWCRHYLARDGGKGPTLAVAIGRKAGRLVFVWPLVAERHAGLTVLSFLGDPVSQYGDIVAAPEARGEAVLLRAWQFVMTHTRADAASLRKVRSTSLAAKVLGLADSRVVAEEEAPFVDFSKSTQGPDGRFHHATRRRTKNRRRQLRRLEEHGTVDFATLEPGPEAAATVEQAIQLKREWLARKNEISRAFVDDRFLGFFRDVVADVRNVDAPCRVSVLRSSGAVAAIQITLACRDRHFLHISVYEPIFEKFAAGGLLLENRLDDAFLAGARVYDLLPPRYEYKMEFADSVERVCDYAVAITLAGRVHTAVFQGLKRQLKAALVAMPEPVRRGAAALHRRLGGRRTAPAKGA